MTLLILIINLVHVYYYGILYKGIDGCYLMVEFNDVGPDNEIVPEDSKLLIINFS